MSRTVLNGKVTILICEDGLRMELFDVASNVLIATIKLTAENTVRALSRIARTECEFTIPDSDNLEVIGKIVELDKLEFKLPPNTGIDNRVDAARIGAPFHCPPGWKSDNYFGSQLSFFTKNDEEWARTTIRRWVEPESE